MVEALIAEAAAAHDVDANLVRAVIQVESAFRPKARSHKGAIGLMQLMPATAREYGVRNAQVDALDGRINADPKRASIIHPQEARSELEIALARMATYPDSEILDDLVRLGERQLIDGNKEALYLLRWFLDHEQLDLRANALAALLGCTRPDLCPDPPDKLVAGSYDADFIKRRTQEWLAWWRENEAVFQPKRFPPQWIR